MTKTKLSPHSKERLKQRYDGLNNLKMKEISEHLRNRNLIFVKKLTLSRTLAYIEKEGEAIKVIVRKKDNSAVTVLPLMYDYSFGPKEILFEGILYKIIIYPDCFIETKNPRTMTKFYILDPHTNVWVDYKKTKEPFEAIFKTIWSEYETKTKEKLKDWCSKEAYTQKENTIKEI